MSRYVEFNPNPQKRRVGDCAVRAMVKAVGNDWETAYSELAIEGYIHGDMPSANSVWGAFLRKNGFKKALLPDDYPDDYAVKDFCDDNPHGTFVLALAGHVVAVVDGAYYDSWNSGDEAILYYWYRKDE